MGAQAWAAQRVADGVSVLGVDLSGMSQSEAKSALTQLAADLEATPLELTAANFVHSVSPSEAGLELDVDGTASQVVGFTLDPARLIARVQGGGAVEPDVSVDRGTFVAAIDKAVAELNRDQSDADVRIDNARVVADGGDPFIEVDATATADAVLAAWPHANVVEVVAQIEHPEVTRAQAEAFAALMNSREFAEPIRLLSTNRDVELDAATWSAHARVVDRDGTLTLEVDGEALAAELLEQFPDLNNDARGASVSFDDAHQLVVDAGAPGRIIDGKALADAVLDAASRPSRAVLMPYEITEPVPVVPGLDVSDFKEKVSSFDTPLTNERIRTLNLIHAASKVRGTILLPGDTFDLTEVLSPITREGGYYSAGVITNGVHTEAIGGGLSQMATTSYNAAYFAGFDILKHRQHSVWLPRYPAGRESTIYVGQINMVFKNDTPYAAVMNSYVANNRLYVEVWSTPHYTVNTWASPKTNVRAAGTQHVAGDHCVPSAAGQAGFTITNYRQVFLGDELVKDEADTWTYRPDHAIVCD